MFIVVQKAKNPSNGGHLSLSPSVRFENMKYVNVNAITCLLWCLQNNQILLSTRQMCVSFFVLPDLKTKFCSFFLYFKSTTDNFELER